MRISLVLFFAIVLSGCTLAIDSEKYKGLEPEFRPEVFFDGKLKAWGIVQNRSGNVIQQFTVDIVGDFDSESGVLTLDEKFNYLTGDGVKTRQWKIKNSGQEGDYVGKAPDILKTANGRALGNSLHWRYEMDLPVEDKTYRVKFEDWMWAFDEQQIINRSYIKKFGLVMAEVTIFMQRVD